MITPAYTLTATERVLPQMALDFTTGSLDARVTVTRALNTATRTTASGLIETVNADLPRFDYDPVTLSPKGLLIEEARTNLLTYSEAFGTAWSVVTESALDADTLVSPSGVQNADTLRATVATAQFPAQIYRSTSLSTNTTYTYSTYAKKGSSNYIALRHTAVSGNPFAWFNLNTGVIGTVNAGITATITPVGDGWYRCAIVGTTGASISVNRIDALVSDNDGNYVCAQNGSVYVWGAQLEAGAFATSYIPTTTVSLTRNADVVDMTGTNFSDWYNATEGSIYAEYTPFTVSGSQRGVFSINDGTTNNSADWRPNGGDFVVNSGGANQADMYPGGVAVNTIGKGLLALKLNSMACAKNGGAVSSANTALMPVSPNRLNIGRLNNNATLSICGWMRKIMYWPQRVTDAEVRAFSK